MSFCVICAGVCFTNKASTAGSWYYLSECFQSSRSEKWESGFICAGSEGTSKFIISMECSYMHEVSLKQRLWFAAGGMAFRYRSLECCKKAFVPNFQGWPLPCPSLIGQYHALGCTPVPCNSATGPETLWVLQVRDNVGLLFLSISLYHNDPNDYPNAGPLLL